MSCSSPVHHRRLRAPQQHGQALQEPALEAALDCVQRNRQRRELARLDLQGRWLQSLASQGRSELVRAAVQYTSQYRSLPAIDDDDPPALILAGHQPELVHPGVWYKNFVLSEVGRRSGGLAINLLIDNDPLRHTSIRVPSGSRDLPQLETVAFDDRSLLIPYEERPIVDQGCFASFGHRVQQTIRPWIAEPLVERLWPLALEARQRTDRLGQCLAQARHQLEGQLGLETLELPLSILCQQTSFLWFVAHQLAQAPRLYQVYNDALHQYRAANRIRSRSHPVPDLHRQEDWFEAPFWVWTAQQPDRRRLWVRHVPQGIQLHDGGSWHADLPLDEHRDAQAAVEALDQWQREGLRIRPRALTTTMFTRLVLSDLFLHGIGGAKYDQLTDLILQRFYDVEPAELMVVTATARLPIPRPDVREEDLRSIDWQLRQLRYHPELFAGDEPPARRWVEQKRKWIATPLPPGHRGDRHRAIEQANQQLYQLLEPVRDQLSDERERLVQQLRQARMLGSREFAFCLFPEKTLRGILLDLLTKEP